MWIWALNLTLTFGAWIMATSGIQGFYLRFFMSAICKILWLINIPRLVNHSTCRAITRVQTVQGNVTRLSSVMTLRKYFSINHFFSVLQCQCHSVTTLWQYDTNSCIEEKGFKFSWCQSVSVVVSWNYDTSVTVS